MTSQASTEPEVTLDAGPECVDEACEVMHRAFAEYSLKGRPSGALVEDARSLRAEMADGTHLAVVRVGGRMTAMVKYHRTADGALYFGRLGVLPEARGQGLAGLLVRELRVRSRDEGTRGLTCCVRANEPGNIALYEHLGMRIVGRTDRPSLTGAVIPVVHMSDLPMTGVALAEVPPLD